MVNLAQHWKELINWFKIYIYFTLGKKIWELLFIKYLCDELVIYSRVSHRLFYLIFTVFLGDGYYESHLQI